MHAAPDLEPVEGPEWSGPEHRSRNMPLSDTQLIVLSAAFERDDHSILPLPPRIKGGAVAKVCHALVAKGLVETFPLGRDVIINDKERIFRRNQGEAVEGLRLTALALKELNVEPDGEGEAAVETHPIAEPVASEPEISNRSASVPRSGSKLERLIALLRRKQGVSINEASELLAWMPHSVRGAVAGALKKKYALTIQSEKIEGRGTVYRIAQGDGQ
jgi:hypothetical protein